MRIPYLTLLALIQLSILTLGTMKPASAQNTLTSEQFQSALTACATQQGISVSSDAITSIGNIYADPVARSALSNPSVLIALMPENDRLAVYKLYAQCISSMLPQDLRPQSQTVVTYKVCTGEYEKACPPHDKYLYCYSDVDAWAKSLCTSYKIQRVTTFGGNRCGYSLDTVICTGPR